MIVTLMGPGELGHWFLTDDNANSYPLISCHEDHPGGAALLGWKAPNGIKEQEVIIMDALDWLMDHTGEDFKAPQHVAQYFRELEEENNS